MSLSTGQWERDRNNLVLSPQQRPPLAPCALISPEVLQGLPAARLTLHLTSCIWKFCSHCLLSVPQASIQPFPPSGLFALGVP